MLEQFFNMRDENAVLTFDQFGMHSGLTAASGVTMTVATIETHKMYMVQAAR